MTTHHLDQGLLRQDLQTVARMIRPHQRVLDLGCGTGDLLAYVIGAMGCTGMGVERDPQAVLEAISRGVPLVELDLDTQLDEFGSDSFDVVVLSRTLQAVRRPKDLLLQMRRIGRKLIVTSPNFAYLPNRLRLLTGRMPQSKDLPYRWYNTPNRNYTTLVTLEELFDECKLDIHKRIPLTGDGRTPRLPISIAQRSANIFAGSAIYELNRRDDD